MCARKPALQMPCVSRREQDSPPQRHATPIGARFPRLTGISQTACLTESEQ